VVWWWRLRGLRFSRQLKVLWELKALCLGRLRGLRGLGWRVCGWRSVDVKIA
jgi:hypothetical protein